MCVNVPGRFWGGISTDDGLLVAEVGALIGFGGNYGTDLVKLQRTSKMTGLVVDRYFFPLPKCPPIMIWNSQEKVSIFTAGSIADLGCTLYQWTGCLGDRVRVESVPS